MISQTMNLLRSKLDHPMVAQPFSSLSAHKSIKHHEKLGRLSASTIHSSARPTACRAARR